MPQIINPESEEHWLQLKTEDISSTEISALFGISPYSTRFEMWHQKKSGEVQRIDDNERMRWGRRMEDTIAHGVAEDLGLKVRRLKTYQRHDTCKGMGSSFDYEIVGVVDDDGKKLCCTPEEAKNEAQRLYLIHGAGILEIKNVDYLIYRDQWEEDEAPPHIEAQLQLQLEVTNRAWGLIVPLVSGNQIHYIPRERNKKIGAAMIKKINAFWHSIVENKPPEPDFETDADFIMRLYGDANTWTVDVTEDEELKPLVEQYFDLNMQAKDVKDLKDAVKARILHEVQGGAKKITCGDFSISCGVTKDTPPVVVTEDMIGDELGGRKSYRMFKIFRKKKETALEKANKPAEVKPVETIKQDEEIIL